jgi:chromate transporter
VPSIHNDCVRGEAAVSNEIQSETQAISRRALALTFLKLGTIGFDGGMAMIALMEQEFVGKRRVMDAEEFLHGVGLGQILGPFAVNTAFFIGYRMHAAVGGLISAGAFMFPSVALVLALSWLYFAYHAIPAMQGIVGGLGPVVISLIVSAAWTMGRKALRSRPIALLCVLAVVAGLWKLSPIAVLVIAGVLGLSLGKRRLTGRGNPPKPASASSPSKKKGTVNIGLVPWFLTAQGVSAAGGVSLGKLGLTFLKVGLVFFGGGFVLIPVLHRALVVNLGWLNPQEFIDGIAISNLTPGPIAVLATFAGYRMLGIAGALTATLALFLPGVVLMFILCHQYERIKDGTKVQDFLAGVVPAVIGLILSAAVLLSFETIHSWQGYALAAVSILLLIRWRLHPIFVLALGALAGATSILR